MMIVIVILGCLKVLSDKILKRIMVYIYITEIRNAVVCRYQSAIWGC